MKQNNRKSIVQVLILVTACIFIIYGITRNETAVVLNKAVNICLECIGLG